MHRMGKMNRMWLVLLLTLMSFSNVSLARRYHMYADDSPATKRWEAALKKLSIRCTTLARMVATEISGDPDQDCQTLSMEEFEKKIEFACYYEEYLILKDAICGKGYTAYANILLIFISLIMAKYVPL